MVGSLGPKRISFEMITSQILSELRPEPVSSISCFEKRKKINWKNQTKLVLCNKRVVIKYF